MAVKRRRRKKRDFNFISVDVAATGVGGEWKSTRFKDDVDARELNDFEALIELAAWKDDVGIKMAKHSHLAADMRSVVIKLKQIVPHKMS